MDMEEEREERKWEAKSHSSFDYLRELRNFSVTVSIAAMTARKEKTTEALHDYYNATLEFYHNAIITLAPSEQEELTKKMEDIHNKLRMMGMSESQRKLLLFPPNKIDYTYRTDMVFIDRKEPTLPEEYTTSGLGNGILDGLGEVFVAITKKMQKNYKLLLRIGRIEEEEDLSDINKRLRKKREFGEENGEV